MNELVKVEVQHEGQTWPLYQDQGKQPLAMDLDVAAWLEIWRSWRGWICPTSAATKVPSGAS